MGALQTESGKEGALNDDVAIVPADGEVILQRRYEDGIIGTREAEKVRADFSGKLASLRGEVAQSDQGQHHEDEVPGKSRDARPDASGPST
jgi:predicted AlkP superfamily phosphohydrolase/phosphomutase